jgi:Ferritin-like domain
LSTGVTAYNGAASSITNSGFLDAAAGILAVEAYHAGAVRALLQSKAYNNVTLAPYGAKIGDVVNAVANLRALVGGGKDATLDKLVPADENAIAFRRSVDEVLAIVYLGGKEKGGFFPEGISVDVTGPAMCM